MKGKITRKLLVALSRVAMRDPQEFAPEQYEFYAPSFHDDLRVPDTNRRSRLVGKGDYEPPLSPQQMEAYEAELAQREEALTGDTPDAEDLVDLYDDQLDKQS